MTKELRAFEVDFNEVASDGTLVCHLFKGYRPIGMPLHPEESEVVALYDEDYSMLAQVLWSSGGEVEVEILHHSSEQSK